MIKGYLDGIIALTTLDSLQEPVEESFQYANKLIIRGGGSFVPNLDNHKAVVSEWTKQAPPVGQGWVQNEFKKHDLRKK